MNYFNLKKDRNGIPNYLSLEPIVLELTKDGQNWLTSKLQDDTVEKVISLDGYDINNDDKLKTLKRNAHFAVSRLYKQGFIDRPLDKTYRISSKGIELINMHQRYEDVFAVLDKANKKYSKQVSEARRKNTSKNIRIIKNETAKSSDNLIDEVDTMLDDNNVQLKSLLMKKLMEKDGIFFEHVVNKLLTAMGYKGKHGDAITTQPTRDHGVDGLISKDPLGIDTIAFQAKRYSADNKVGSRDIRDFNGYLNGERKGIFITTSTLMDSAKEELTSKNYPIKIINGNQLTNLMIEYGVGVQTKRIFKLLTIDNDFFE